MPEGVKSESVKSRKSYMELAIMDVMAEKLESKAINISNTSKVAHNLIMQPVNQAVQSMHATN